jgi:hypothetical protein
MSTQEQAFSLSDFLEEDLFDPGNAATMPESQSFPFAPIDVEHLFFSYPSSFLRTIFYDKNTISH